MKKVFEIWAGATVTILISVPTIAAIIEISHQAAKITFVSNHGVVAVVILVTGYALIWKTFTAIDQVAGKIGGVVQSATGRMQKGLAKYRGDTMKRRLGEAVEGKREIRGARMATGLVRRAQHADEGGLTPTRAAQRRYQGARRAQMQRNVEEMMKRDGGRSGGDDDLMEIVMRQRGRGAEERTRQEYYGRLMTRQRAAAIRAANPTLSEAAAMNQATAEFRRMGADRFSRQMGVNGQEAMRMANERVGALKSNFGADVGTDAMRVAAFKSLTNSKTSYTDPTGANEQDNWERMIGDANELMADGLITSTDATMAIKQRADRADRAGVGFGTLQGQIEKSFTRYQQGARRGLAGAGGELVTQGEARTMRKEALFGTAPGGVVAGRHEAVSALSGVMRDNVEEVMTNLAAAQSAHAAAVAAGGGVPTVAQQATIDQANLQIDQAQEQVDRELAAIAGRYDAMGQISPQNATIMANNVMSQVIPGGPVNPAGHARAGQPMTIQDMIESARGRAGFLEMRREYMASQLAGAQAMQQQQIANAQGMPPVVGANGP